MANDQMQQTTTLMTVATPEMEGIDASIRAPLLSSITNLLRRTALQDRRATKPSKLRW